MKKIIYLTAALGMILLGGCNKKLIDGPGGLFFSKSYIQVFSHADSLSCWYMSSENHILVLLIGKGAWNEKPHVEEYEALCEYFGDTGYNREIRPSSTWALADEFLSADIVSDNDFDAAHPAGTSLGDIVTFSGTTYYPYIKGGYKGEESMLIYKPVSKVTADDMKLLCLSPSVYFQFNSKPALKNHTFTITFRNAEKEVTGDITVVFE